MRILFGLLALALLGADGQAPANAPASSQTILYELRVVEMPGVEWRGEVYTKLQPVTHQGNASVWTAPKDVAAVLAKRVETEPQARLLMAPRVLVQADQRAEFTMGSSRNFVTDMTRVANGPLNHATSVAWVPKIESNREGLAGSVRGRKLDQGILAQVTLDDSRVISVHDVKLTETLEPARSTTDAKAMNIRIEVPEVARSSVSGEWLIPNDGVLLVSLGVATVAEKDGKAGIRERIAIIEAKAMDLPQKVASIAAHRALYAGATFHPGSVTGVLNGTIGNVAPMTPPVTSHVFQGIGPAEGLTAYADRVCSVPPPTVAANTPVTIAPPVPHAATPIPMPAPVVPSRSLPQPLDGKGQAVALPPLPVDRNVAPTSMPGTSDPCATPQTHPQLLDLEPVPERSSNLPRIDVASSRASYEPDACNEPAGKSREAGPGAVAPRTATFRFPLGGSVTVEIRAVVSPATTSPTSTQKWPAPPLPH